MDIKRHLFVIGTRVHCILGGGKNGIVFRIEGRQSPESVRDYGAVVMGGSATFRIVFDDHISVVPEAVVRGVQWRLREGVANADEIEVALTRAVAARAKAERVSKEKSDRKAAESADLPSRYPWLKPVSGSGLSSHAMGAKNIRAELKRVFPGVKFRVRSRSFAGGDSIDVGWCDAATVKQVERITAKYQEGHFDGMTDCYDFDTESVWPAVFGGAKYVHERREHSEVLLRRAAEDVGVEYRERYEHYDDQQRVYCRASELSLCEPKTEAAQERDHSEISLPDEFTHPVSAEEKGFADGFKKGKGNSFGP